MTATTTMSKRPLCVDDLPSGPSSPVPDAAVSSAYIDFGVCRRRQTGNSAELSPDSKRPQAAATEVGADGNGTNGCRRRPDDLAVRLIVTSNSDAAIATGSGGDVIRVRRDRCSPSGCKRPMAIALPRLNFSLIRDTSRWSQNETKTSPAPGSNILTPSNISCDRLSGLPSPASYPNPNAKNVPSSSSSVSGCTYALDDANIPSPLSGSSVQPTNILPFLFLGSQSDALSEEVISKNRIEYVINVSMTSPQSPFVADRNFLRIPVNDGHSDRLLPFFRDAFQFLDTVRESSSCVLVHCLAGISRSPTLVIAYVMHHLRLSIDEAYRYVKERRPSISPNFNFLGQLVEYESQLQLQRGPSLPPQPPSRPSHPHQPLAAVDKGMSPERAPSPIKRPCIVNLAADRPPTDRRSLHLSGLGSVLRDPGSVSSLAAQSPTTALAKLKFDRVGQRRPTSKFGSVRSPDAADGFQPFPATFGFRLDNKRGSVGSVTSSSDSGSGATSRESSPQLLLAMPPVAVGSVVGAGLHTVPSNKFQTFSSVTPFALASNDGRNLSVAGEEMASVTSTVRNVDVMSVDTEDSCTSSATATTRDLLWQTVQACMKSRSFEDILLLSTAAVAADCSTSGDKSQVGPTTEWSTGRRDHSDSDDSDDDDRNVSGGASGLATGSRQNGSMTSLASHASLHGSLEIIQVS